MKFQITKNIEVPPSRLFAILCNTSLRKKWIPIFEEGELTSIKTGVSFQSKYFFLKEELCSESYFRVIENKELSLTIESSKGIWTVFVVLVETEDGTEVTVMVELASNAWLSTIMLWLESGKLQIFADEFLSGLKEYAELQELQSASS